AAVRVVAGRDIFALPLHDALPISLACNDPDMFEVMSASELGTSNAPPMPCTPRAMMSTSGSGASAIASDATPNSTMPTRSTRMRSEEHTSELQSRENLVCRLLLEK